MNDCEMEIQSDGVDEEGGVKDRRGKVIPKQMEMKNGWEKQGMKG